MKIKVQVSLGLVGCQREAEFEIEDDADDATIEEVAREGWEKKT